MISRNQRTNIFIFCACVNEKKTGKSNRKLIKVKTEIKDDTFVFAAVLRFHLLVLLHQLWHLDILFRHTSIIGHSIQLGKVHPYIYSVIYFLHQSLSLSASNNITSTPQNKSVYCIQTWALFLIRGSTKSIKSLEISRLSRFLKGGSHLKLSC